MPENRGLNKMSEPTREDQGTEEPEDWTERHILPLPDEIDQHQRDGEIRAKDGDVRNNVQPAVSLRPLPSVTARWKATGIEEVTEKRGYWDV